MQSVYAYDGGIVASFDFVFDTQEASHVCIIVSILYSLKGYRKRCGYLVIMGVISCVLRIFGENTVQYVLAKRYNLHVHVCMYTLYNLPMHYAIA